MNTLSLNPATRARLRLLYPHVAELYIRFAGKFYEVHNRIVGIAQGVRLWEYQDELYAQGRTTPGDIVTWAKGGSSWHNYAVAIDVCFQGKDPYLKTLGEKEREAFWDEIGRIAKEFQFEWGGDFPEKKRDRPHLQKPYGLTIVEAQKLYKEGGLERVWREFDVRRGVPVGTGWYGPQPVHDLLKRGIL